jgi:SAM-dependent methyltransferase
MTDAAMRYVGDELELFSGAVNWKAWFADQMAIYISGRVLEAGAGIGSNTRALFNDRVTRWLLLEPDKTQTAAIREKLDRGELPDRCDAREGTTADLADDEMFDTILYIDVLEHIRADRDEMARASRHLAIGGHLIVLSPAHQFLFSPFDQAIGHERRYNRRTIVALSPVGCRVVSVKMLDSAGFFLSLGNRLLMRSAMPTPGQIRLWDKFFVPVSRWLDPLTGFRFGKSIVIIWNK